MASPEELKALCFDDRGGVKPKTECRSVLINHLILDEMMDVMDAEDLTEKSLREFDLWPEEEAPPKEEPLP